MNLYSDVLPLWYSWLAKQAPEVANELRADQRALKIFWAGMAAERRRQERFPKVTEVEQRQ